MNLDAVEISGSGFSYSALVGCGLLATAGELVRQQLSGDCCAVIADETSARLFGDSVCESFRSQNFLPRLIRIPAGEQSKSLTHVERICDQMIEAKLDRSSFVVGLGGGVIGDISGFVASTFQRGIPHIQIPTTLLAMVDSSIGGKTGVNLSAGKNLIGTIHHAALVIADVETLESLPPRELRQGYAEIIKHAIIRDAEMFHDLSSEEKQSKVERSGGISLNSQPDSPARAQDNRLVALIRRNIAIKAAIVSADAREVSGERALLNFGHTIGHAIERAADFRIPHGDCVSIGMVAACNISIKRARFSVEERDALVALLKKFELPTRLPDEVDRKKAVATVAHDKKFLGGEIRFVVTPRIGEARVSNEVTMADICDAIAEL